MRKIKIYLKLLAIAGVLFATTTSCVDNTESESVSALRNAKASELLANADYLKAKAAIEQTYANAELALKTALAATEAANAEYLKSLGKKAEAEGKAQELLAEAEKLLALAEQTKAEAAKIEAEGQKAKLEAEADKLLAEVKKIEAEASKLKSEADAAAAIAAEKLRVTQAKNNVTIAEQEAALDAAEHNAKMALIEQQRLYVAAVGKLEVEIAKKYVELIGNLTTVLDDINTQKSAIATATIKIARAETELAGYLIDSVKFVKRFIAATEGSLSIEKIGLKSAQNSLAQWESNDAGLTSLKERKEQLIKDTLDASEALAEANATFADLDAAIVAADAVVADLKSDYDDANAKLESAEKKVADAEAQLEVYLSKTAGATITGYSYVYYYDVPSIDYKGITYYEQYENSYPRRYPDAYGYGYGYGYNYSYGYTYIDDDAITVQKSEYFDIIDGEDQPIYSTSITWSVTVAEKSYEDYESVYTSLPALEYKIGKQKVDTADKALLYANAAAAVKNSVDSLAQYGSLELTTASALRAAKKVTEAASIAYTAAEQKFYELEAKAQLPTATRRDTLAWEEAGSDYDWRNVYTGATLPGANRSKYQALQDATTAETKASTANTDAKAKYDSYNAQVKTNIETHITSKGVYEISVRKLADLEALLPILKLGTRDKLVFALDEVKKAKNELLESAAYKTAVDAYKTAVKVYDAAVDAYGFYELNELAVAKNTYKSKIDDYDRFIEFEEWQISLGGTEYLLLQKELNIASFKRAIADYEENIAKYESQLADVAKYVIDDFGQTVASVIESYKKQIADNKAKIATAEAKIKELEQQAKYYQDAVDAFLAEYGE